jgi:acyl dehydratase
MRHLEDFHAGQVFACGPHTVTKEEIFDFAREFDPQPHHLDEEAAKRSMLGGLSASGWHVCAMAWRMACDGLLLDADNRGGSRVAETRWMKPVRPDDVLRLEIHVVAVEVSPTRPELGFVSMEWRIFNQVEQVGLMLVTPRIGKRSAAA